MYVQSSVQSLNVEYYVNFLNMKFEMMCWSKVVNESQHQLNHTSVSMTLIIQGRTWEEDTNWGTLPKF